MRMSLTYTLKKLIIPFLISRMAVFLAFLNIIHNFLHFYLIFQRSEICNIPYQRISNIKVQNLMILWAKIYSNFLPLQPTLRISDNLRLGVNMHKCRLLCWRPILQLVVILTYPGMFIEEAIYIIIWF